MKFLNMLEKRAQGDLKDCTAEELIFLHSVTTIIRDKAEQEMCRRTTKEMKNYQ